MPHSSNNECVLGGPRKYYEMRFLVIKTKTEISDSSISDPYPTQNKK